MNYDQWRKLAVATTDLRTINGIEDGLRDIPTPVPGVAFLKPVMGDFRGHPVIERFDCLGWITQDPKRGMFDVLIENTEREFVDFEQAARYLWDNYYKSQLDVTPYLVIGVNREGEIYFHQKASSEDHMLEMIRNELPEYDTVEERDGAFTEMMNDMTRVGGRFHEFVGGHFAAFPLED